MMPRIIRLLAWTCLLMAANSPAATHYLVPTNPAAADPYTNWAMAGTNIIDVVNAALTNSAPRILWVTNGTYYPTNSFAVTNVMTIQSMNGRDVTIFSGGGIGGPYTNRFASFSADSASASEHCVLDGFTISNFYLNTAASGSGGAVFGYGLTVQNCLFIKNRITASSGSIYGGGVFLRKYGTVSNCVFKNNYARSYGGALGVGDIVSVTLPVHYTITGCRFEGNSTGLSGGGACLFFHHNVTVSDCVIVSNSCADYGGGLYFATASNIVVRNCLIASNRVSGGSPNQGGGIYFAASTTGSVESCTVVTNNGGSGGGIYSASVSITGINNIIYYNTAASAANFTNAAGNAGLSYSCVTPAVDGIGNITDDPGLKDIAGDDYSLSRYSPCINKGTNQSWMTLQAGGLDLDGNRRIIMGVVDMGAYEAPPPAMTVFIGR